MIVLSEDGGDLKPSASLRDIHASTEAARLAGCRVYHIPADFSRCETAENALAHVPEARDEPAAWIGYIPSEERYRAIYRAAAARGLRLLNTPEEHLRAMEFHRMYPCIRGLTPASRVCENEIQLAQAADELGFPLFLKGAIQSRKSRGLKACLAEDREQLMARGAALFELENRSRGRVIVREFARLRHVHVLPGDFPQGREYRVFLYQGDVLIFGYYWDEPDELAALEPEAESVVRDLARRAAERMEVPYLTVDIGQLESGEWTVIETGDAQFSGLSRVAPLRLWSKLQAAAK